MYKDIKDNPNQIKLLKKAKSKYISRALANALLKHNQNSFLQKKYKATILFCAEALLKAEDKNTLKTSYCKNRWCVLCNRIRTANLINGYLQPLQQIENKYFVTLTLPTVNEKNLRGRIKLMEDEWRNMMKLKHKENRFENFDGVRKMECTIRPQGLYHYHYHVILGGKAQAEWLLFQWLKRFPAAAKRAQDIRPADDNSVKELFKYFTKLLAKDDGLFPTAERKFTQFKRLDYIFRILHGKRIYQSFGKIRKVSEEITEKLIEDLEVPQGFNGKIWKWSTCDWESELGEVLSNYEPTATTEQLIKNC